MHLFVYGTLMSGIPSSMSKFLNRHATLIGPATGKGQLLDLGMYPGFVADGEDEVVGELYVLTGEDPTTTWSMLDAYEGVTGEAEDEYRRIGVEAVTAGGESLPAQVYEYTGNRAGRAVIPGGDYRAFYPTRPAHVRFINGG